ncbi:PTS fructose transporter subunit IIC [Streptobacillus moniliformis]|uniref:PTS system, fructose subfamily, IIC subunit n=1 Tax=Streptobacillus moniliformis (strain ATCC 14647 / DSM 12112 / NCTC 10651 / 9901) TaxID=519441 RepID=D1AWC9_STRM9|nr:fructose-specific PTS transporter subunit EIIC [Streptobacillus moniliformis]ACZ00605.1 PTS system, fructose subfamily, IIC subunit [Streptobacillus moniliformis DSM 12112]AVL42983.1 PTS fructose transporter subunit IIC [Streptobacillus moniliformis]SQA14272.1 EIIABC-Fru [Streptobacillus moniliformis]
MKLTELLRENQVIFNLNADNKKDAIIEMAKVFKPDVINDQEKFIEDLFARESLSHTALELGVATPHAKSRGVSKPALVIAIKKEGIDFSEGQEDKSKLFFMIAVPENEGNLHIDILTKLADVMLDNDKLNALLNSTSYDEVIDIIEKEKIMENKESEKFVVAVTACPTGIAHTFMAKDALIKAAKELGVNIKVETNGTNGRKDEITKEDLEKASGVILAINKSVNEERFNGYKVIKVGAKDGINKAKELILDTLSGKGTIANFESSGNSTFMNNGKKGMYNHLMSGVSYMLPLVISGGILIALAFLFDSLAGNSNVGGGFGSTSKLAATFMQIGGAAFGLFVPILAGYVAYSIGEKSSLAAGLVAGALASSGGSGFLGALVGGLFAGYVTKFYSKVTSNIKKQLQGINLILFTPVITVLLTGLVMLFLLNPMVSGINTGITNFLESMSASSRILLGALLGGMMAVDMGGPVNKAAYVFGTGTLAATVSTGGSSAMAAVMAGGMVPPLAIAISTTVFKNKYNKEEREAGLSNYIMGISFITEGAIPFAAANPLRVLPGAIIGAAISGALTMLFNIKIPAPHGGILVMFLSSNFFLYLLAIVIGSIVGAIILGLLKEKR